MQPTGAGTFALRAGTGRTYGQESGADRAVPRPRAREGDIDLEGQVLPPPRRTSRGPILGRLEPLLTGATLGLLILGGGGRLAMRGVTLWEGRAHLFSVAGTLRVLAWGAGLGAAAAVARTVIERAAARWTPTAAPSRRAAIAWLVTLAIALVLLTPWTLPRLVLFPPVVLAWLAALEATRRRRSVRDGAGVDREIGAASASSPIA